MRPILGRPPNPGQRVLRALFARRCGLPHPGLQPRRIGVRRKYAAVAQRIEREAAAECPSESDDGQMTAAVERSEVQFLPDAQGSVLLLFCSNETLTNGRNRTPPLRECGAPSTGRYKYVGYRGAGARPSPIRGEQDPEGNFWAWYESTRLTKGLEAHLRPGALSMCSGVRVPKLDGSTPDSAGCTASALSIY